MEEKDIEKLIELVIAGGELRGDAFHFSEQEKREFAERNGGDKDLQARTDRKVRDVASLEYDKVTLRKKRTENLKNSIYGKLEIQGSQGEGEHPRGGQGTGLRL